MAAPLGPARGGAGSCASRKPSTASGSAPQGQELLSKHTSKHSVRASSSQEQQDKASQPAGLHRAIHRNTHRV